jgi:hypothetical protein
METAPIRQELEGQGFSTIPHSAFRLNQQGVQDLEALQSECAHLPLDPQAKNGERRRRYGSFVITPANGSLTLVFNANLDTYWQPPALNKDAAGEKRRFAQLTPTMLQNSFLRDLICADFTTLPLNVDDLLLPWLVGVHFVQMVARPGLPGISSPDRPHKDGEPFTAIHLVHRDAFLLGGINRLLDNAKQPLCDKVLLKTLDTQIVRDDAVYHQVTRIEVPDTEPQGTRTVLLIDFTPLYPHPNQYD